MGRCAGSPHALFYRGWEPGSLTLPGPSSLICQLPTSQGLPQTPIWGEDGEERYLGGVYAPHHPPTHRLELPELNGWGDQTPASTSFGVFHLRLWRWERHLPGPSLTHIPPGPLSAIAQDPTQQLARRPAGLSPHRSAASLSRTRPFPEHLQGLHSASVSGQRCSPCCCHTEQSWDSAGKNKKGWESHWQ